MELIKNNEIVNYFTSKNAAHAVLIEGAEGSGKLTAARFAAKALTCTNANAPCGECSFCTRIDVGQFPDVSELIERQPSSNIAVERIRQLLLDAYIVPGEAERRVFIIGDFERIQTYAQNALLKVLEEPPKNVHFILLAQSRTSILPTILSRTVHLKTELLDMQTIESFLSKHYPDGTANIKQACRLCQGALGKAIRYMEDPALFEPYDLVKKYILMMSSGASFTSLCAILSPFRTKREELPSLAGAFTDAIRDVMAIGQGAEPVCFEFPDSVKFIGPKKIAAALEIIGEISRDFKNINIISAITRLNMTFAEK